MSIAVSQVLESEMSNQDSGAKIDGVDVNQVCGREEDRERWITRDREREGATTTMKFRALCWNASCSGLELLSTRRETAHLVCWSCLLYLAGAATYNLERMKVLGPPRRP